MNLSTPSFWPKKVYITPEAREDTISKNVLSRLPKDVVIEEISERRDPLREDSFSKDSERFSQGKRTMLLTRHLGSWLKACPGTEHHVCCNLWIVNPGEGCPLDCTYCYLQSYLKRNPTMKIYTNTEAMLLELEQRAAERPDKLFRVGTGEVMDSLVWDELTDLTTELVPFFARKPNLILELKSKYAGISNLLHLKNEHQGKTVVSWSVNAREISRRDEAFTSSLEERIEAACKLAEVGYRIGLHFDPLILFSGWEDGYRDTIRYIFSELNPKHIAWISVSSLRYKRDMQEMMQERFPESQIPFGEQVLGKDSKLRYVQPLRLKLINFVWKELKAISPNFPVYMCMESASAWNYIAGGPPAAGAELVEVFSKKGRLPIVQEVALEN